MLHITFYNFLGNGQSYTGAFIFRFVVQLLENNKHFIRILFFNAYTIILHSKQPVIVFFAGAYSNFGRYVFFPVFDGIADKVLK